jgi:hypothetical protein
MFYMPLAKYDGLKKTIYVYSIGLWVYPIRYTIHNIRHHDRCLCSNGLTTPLQ